MLVGDKDIDAVLHASGVLDAWEAVAALRVERETLKNALTELHDAMLAGYTHVDTDDYDAKPCPVE